MDYTALVASVQRYTQNDETNFVAELPNFVKLAEHRIFDQVQLLVARKNVTSTTTINDPYIQAPTDFLAPYSLAVNVAGTYTPLLVVDETFIREAYSTPTTVGVPVHYALFDHNTMILGPTPASSAYTVELHYFYYPDSLVDTTPPDETWLSQFAPNALLYGTLLEAYRFMKAEEDIMAATQNHYTQAMQALQLLSAARDRGDAYRYGQFKTPIQA